LPLSILTDFEEFAVYDCRVKPDQKDKASVARILYISFTEYATRWEEIASVFSRDAVLKGSFDKYAEENKAKRGTAAVDDAFLQTIESWRKALAENLALRNKKLTQRETNFAVQRIIDRIIFLRICEGRGIEDYGKLKALADHDNIYSRLGQLFKEADDRYNSGLFHFKPEKGRHEPPDQLTLNLDLDDKLLRGILKGLYYPESPYVFSALPADVLGQVYEQFLGKVIRLTEGHHAKVEDKPEVKKAGGVYYTPTYIVDYIVENTVGKLLEGKTLKQAAALRILDPACGSGSFLLGAYEYLLQWHLKFYTENDPAKWARGSKPALVQSSGGAWKLTIAERKRILLANIYGVDIDAQAVETTKLSLLLKVLEGETQQSLQPVLLTFQERALPDLGDNIKCGNSLIGPGFYRATINLDDEDRYRINAFDWNKEFSTILNGAGFDAVIGNPPYLFITELDNWEKEYFGRTFSTCEYRFDVYGLFCERAVDEWLRLGGQLSFIIPHTLLSNDSFTKLRKLFLAKTHLRKVIDIGPGVFRAARNETMVFVAETNSRDDKSLRLSDVILTSAAIFPTPQHQFSINQKEWAANQKARWEVKLAGTGLKILGKLEKAGTKLGDLCTINQGLRTGDNDRYLSSTKASSAWKPAAGGKGVARYAPLTRGLFVLYEPSLLDAPRNRAIFESEEKLVVQEIRNITLKRRIIATCDSQQYFCLQSTNVINLKPSQSSSVSTKFLLGLLNSNLTNFFFRLRFSGNNHIASNQLAQIPIIIPDKSRHERTVKLVEDMLALHKRLAAAKTPQEKTSLERQISATDAEIDRLVYELYGLTAEEIKIVEASTPA
jgi:type I restriction-modification system DNA methylase subunit